MTDTISPVLIATMLCTLTTATYQIMMIAPVASLVTIDIYLIRTML